MTAYRKVLPLLALTAFASHSAHANDAFFMQDHQITSFTRAPSAGFYLKVPLGGKPAPLKDRVEYGFALKYNQSYNSFSGAKVNSVQSDMVAVRFNAGGFDRFSLSGTDYHFENGKLAFYADGDKKGSNTATWVLVGVGAVGGLLLIAQASKKDSTDDIEVIPEISTNPNSGGNGEPT